MSTKKDIAELFDATAYDSKGDKLGSVKEIFLDDNSGKPTFVEVNHGLFGLSSSLVPLRGATFENGELRLAFAKDLIKDAPDFDSDSSLTTANQDELNQHYGVGAAEYQDIYEAPAPRGGAREEAARTDVAGAANTTDTKATQDAARTEKKAAADDGSLVRSEEELNVSKENVQTGEARLRKFVVTETETVDVPVSREEVRVVRTPLTGDEQVDGQALTDDEASVILHEERVNVSKDTVAKEKVALQKEQVTGTQRVSEELKKERIETDGVATDAEGDSRK
ncbi:PRC and DUF2382 domain-containing protein [Corynebacterium mastitidis]|uniref:Photosystem reaction center subunit H n=1 Tax=Corynebacterium mastitidis TaxID=161890 RepID=A0A2N0X5U9_9CORY|nr:PRC and DUF2382 domain-containing protein [Corynebacterium mastitidis]MCH6196970.1 PRC and DUF2382 domain-containing protein [Corynebacterium mastitidis]PKF68082.1 photosystem reaction center subunit H [Corynebacterium mastitidis]